jgi:RNA polymerase sigma factor (sigma-70 family)
VAAVPSIGRADRVSGASAPEADLTRALYERYATQIFRFCLHQLGSREEAEDAVQSTFLNAFRGIKRGVVPELESAWLFKIAENVCLSRRRSTWRRNRIESTADFDLVEELTPAPSRLADELVGLQDVLEQMPESQRRAILLREWQGLSYREIAEELELSQTAVETLIFRARRSLAKGLAEPPGPAEKRRMVRGADLGNLLTGLKSILFGGAAAAAKTAAVVAVVGAGTVAVVAPAQHHARSHAPASPPAPVPAASLPLPRLTPSRQAPVPARPARPAASKAAADTTSTPAIANPPVAPAEATPPQETAGDPAPTSASPVAAQAPPASSPASNGQGKARSEGQGNSGQGKGNPPGEGQGNSGQGQGNPPGEGRGNSGQGSTGDQGQGQRNSGGQGPGDSGNQGQGSSGSSSSDAAPPPTGDSNPGGNSGNGQGNGQGDGGGHGAGAGRGH